MNNIEKLAKTHCIGTYQNSEDGERFYFRLQDLEAFAKALQSSEPVAIGEVKENGVTWYKQNPHAHPIGTKFYTHPPASVPVEDAKVQDLILELKCLGEVLAMEMTTIEGNPIAPIVDDAWKTIERLVATQSASVPLEKYNKLLDALKRLSESDLGVEFVNAKCPHGRYYFEYCGECYEAFALKAIAEAEGKEGWSL